MGPKCEGCAKPCESPFNTDFECWGRMTPEEQEALRQAMIRKSLKSGPPVEKPKEKTKTEQGFTWD